MAGIFYPTKIPDLIGIKDRKFLDHTATHRNRGIEDLMRYAAQVMSADSPHFGPYEIVPRAVRRVPYRLSDEADPLSAPSPLAIWRRVRHWWPHAPFRGGGFPP
jgi:hypothetical protein